jgi:hypothetical protein
MKKWILAAIIVVFLPTLGNAGTYWVHPYGTAANYAACSSATDPGGTCESGNCAGYCAYSTANSGAQPGDTIYYKGPVGVPYSVSGGTDASASGVGPQTGGTLTDGVCTAKITYQNAPEETPVIQGATTTGTYYGIAIVGKSCIKVSGFTFQEIKNYGYLRSASYNEITNNTFTATTADGEVGNGIVLSSSCLPNYNCWNTHNWIHDNTIQKKRNGEVCGEGTDLLRIGDDDSGRAGADQTAANDYNTIEDNTIAYASHTPMDSYGNYNVIRNNYFHNEPWWTGADTTCGYPNDTYTNEAYDGKYGHRAFQITDGYERDGMFNLIEGNRAGYGSTNANNNGADGMDIAGPKNIVRYNAIFANMNSGLMFKYGGASAADGNGGINNRTYNNTIYKSGYGNPFYELSEAACIAAGGLNCSTTPQALLGIRFYRDETIDNVIKNTIVYDSRNYTLNEFEIGQGATTVEIPTGTIQDHNWGTVDGDPKFTDPDITDPTSTTLPDLTLQAASTAINAGTFLTQANGAGTNSTALIVDDALYFQDGTWGSSLSDIKPDEIKVGTVTVAISSINYSTNTITLASAIDWADDAQIRLYKKSDGVQVLYSTETDMGAHEYAGATTHTITASKVGSGGNLTPTGEEIVGDGQNSGVYTASIDDGIRGTWSGTCGATGTFTAKTGTKTYQKENTTGDCTVVVTFETIKIGGLVKP